MDGLWDDYLQYLLWRGGLNKMTKYSRLFDILNNIPFAWRIDRDSNREGDGLYIREDYEIPDEHVNKAEGYMFYTRRCSVLEMLIGLAIRVDNEYTGDPGEGHPEMFFMEMLRNLGLDKFKGHNYREIDVLKIVNRWLDREFSPDGRGSPFPVKHDLRDQRKLEIWDQMNSYLSEHYI